MTSLYLFYGIISNVQKQNLFIWPFVLLHIWIFAYVQLSGDLQRVGLLEEPMLSSTGHAAGWKLGNRTLTS